MSAVSDLDELKTLGTLMDTESEMLGGCTTGVFLAQAMLKIRGRNGVLVPLRPNPAQRAFERRRGSANVVLKARQMGLSTWIAGRFFLKTILQPGTLTLQVAHTQEAAQDLFQMVRRFHAELPVSLTGGALKTSRANVRSLVFPKLDSEYRVETAGDANAGRGLTVQNLHCSEVSRWPGNAAETLAGLRAALATDSEVVLESTANGAYGCFYEEWMQAAETGYVRHFFPWWWEPAYVAASGELGELDATELRLREIFGLSVRQISYRRRLQKQFGRMMKQEYPEHADECFLASGQCVFDMEAVDRRLAELGDPIERRWNGTLEVWYPAVAGKQYVVAVDPSGGGSDGDYCAMQVVERATGLQCAELHARLGLHEIAQKCVVLAKEYNDALLVVERNNHGHAVLAYLRGEFRYGNLFVSGGQEGWLTSSLTRPVMLEGLMRVVVEHPEVWNSRRLLRECRTFVRDKAGRMEAGAGEHDDLLMAMGMALQAHAAMR